MRMIRVFFLLLAAASVWAQTTVTYDCATYGANCNVAMPDPSGSIVTVVNSTIDVPSLCGAGQFVSNVSPRLNVVHPNAGDLTILLLTPTFAVSDLVDRPLNQTGSCTGDNILASFYDTASPFACAPNPANGVDPVRPTGPRPLSGILPFVQTGTWTLQMQDNTAPNTGALNGWSLTFTCSPLNVVTIAATDPTGSEAGDPFTFTVTRSGVPALPMFVPFTFTGTATPIVDYSTTPVVFTPFAFIPAGATTGTATYVPVADTMFEGDETVIATIAPSPGYVVGSPSSATATIAELNGTEIPTLSPWMLVLFAAAVAAVALVRS